MVFLILQLGHKLIFDCGVAVVVPVDVVAVVVAVVLDEVVAVVDEVVAVVDEVVAVVVVVVVPEVVASSSSSVSSLRTLFAGSLDTGFTTGISTVATQVLSPFPILKSSVRASLAATPM